MTDFEIKFILFMISIAYILYQAGVKENSWLEQLYNYLMKSIIGKMILIILGIILITLLILIKSKHY
jgi:hypothetical protein